MKLKRIFQHDVFITSTEGILREGSSMSAYEATKGEIKFALFRSAAWAERAFESMRANENRMDAEQLISLRAMLTSERDRMTRARMGATSPDASVWSEAVSWLDARIQERGKG